MEEKRLLYLYDTIDKTSIRTVMENIIKINNEDDLKLERKPMHLHVNSYGGVVYDGLTLISLMEQSKTPIYTYVHGYAMSMGLLTSASGHKRFASKYATFMYHGVSGGVFGQLEFMKNRLDESQRLQELYDQIFLSKTSVRESELKYAKERQKDWFIPASEALKLKIVDELF